MSTDPLADELLFWALESSEGDTTWWMRLLEWTPSSSSRNATDDAVQRAVAVLSAQGLVVGQRAITGVVRQFALTPAGVREAERRRTAVGSRRDRLAYAENAILTWVFDSAPPAAPVQLIDFMSSPAGFFYGSKLTADEVTEASASLVQLKMLTTTGGPLTGVWLAAEGRCCVMSGQTVREYLRRENVQLIQYVLPGAAAAQGMNVTQHLSKPESSQHHDH
ncbi:hypothetical protein ACWC4A_51990 [Streptomyces mirabilis]